MKKSRLPVAVLALLVAAVMAARQAPAPPPASDSEACRKHCGEMAAQCQKMADSRKAVKAKSDTARKEVEAQLASARKGCDEKKFAALEAAVEKFVALQVEVQGSSCGKMAGTSMADRHPTGGSGTGHEMGSMKGHGNMEDCPCCQAGTPAPAKP